MKVVNVYEAKTHLSKLLEEALSGEEIVIARAGKPIVKLVVLPQARPQRQLGWFRGAVRLSPDFDEPLEDFVDYQ